MNTGSQVMQTEVQNDLVNQEASLAPAKTQSPEALNHNIDAGELAEELQREEFVDDAPIADMIAVYTTEKPVCSGEKFLVVYTDDLSLLDQVGQTDGSYADQDGSLYYRQYHRDFYEEGTLWGIYQAAVGTDKEIVYIDADGKRTVLFIDQGYGDIYLIGDRFYMTEMASEKKEDIERRYSKVYSVDMQGHSRLITVKMDPFVLLTGSGNALL